jgi:hypothetical protein
MLDFVCIFNTGGTILWSKSYDASFKLDLINTFIKNILLGEKSAKLHYNFEDSTIKWQMQPDLKLIFAVVYKEMLQLSNIEDLLDQVRFEFVKKVHPTLPKANDLYLEVPKNFDQHFQYAL